MIQRIVIVKLIDAESTPEGRQRMAAGLRAALGSIPGLRGLFVGVPADEASARSWDVSVVAHLDTVADVERFHTHPAHEAFAAAHLRPHAAVVKAWSFEIPG